MIYTINTIQIKLNIKDKPFEKVSSPEAIYAIAKNIFASLDDDQEHFVMFALDSINQIKGYKIITSGGQNNASPDIKIIFRNALLLGAISIIVAHNHPSGNCKPSIEDKAFTLKLKAAGKLIEIEVLDHIILGDNTFERIV